MDDSGQRDGRALALLFAAPAGACPVRLSAAKRGGDTRVTVLRVCGKVLARAVRHKHNGVRMGAASAAGNRVAWIEEHHRSGMRFAVVTVAALGHKVRVLRRFTTQRPTGTRRAC